jgi:hypothetical protein
MSPDSGHAELSAVIVRSVTMTTGFNPWGAGLASDGTHLFAANGTDNIIEQYDLETLQLIRTIDTPIAQVRGLEYRDGIIYVAESEQGGIDGNPSRIYRVSPVTGEVLSFFDAPENAITEISFGTDGLLYGIDGFDNGAGRRTKLHSFNPSDDTLVASVPARLQQIGEFQVPDLLGTFAFLPLSDGTFLADTGGILNQVSIQNNELVRLNPIQGLPRGFSAGSTSVGERVFFTEGHRIGNDFSISVYEFYLIPEPPPLAFLGAALIMVALPRSRAWLSHRLRA